MARAVLTIDLNAIAANWRALAEMANTPTAAVVKADAYGLGMAHVAPKLAAEGAQAFFVATAEEGAKLRGILGPGFDIAVFSGHMAGDAPLIREAGLIPMINSMAQLTRHFEATPEAPFGIQLDSGMNRLGMERAEWASLRDIVAAQDPWVIMTHLSSADEPETGHSPQQLQEFIDMTAGLDAPRSLANTGGILLGEAYCFDLTRPGIGLYGGLPYIDARPAVELRVPVIQTREVQAGEHVGYGGSWVAPRDSRIATIAAGYADGLIRSMSGRGRVYGGEQGCPMVGRVSMDLIGVDVTDLVEVPDYIEVLGRHQSIDSLAAATGTIGYEILTSLGHRYARRYVGSK